MTDNRQTSWAPFVLVALALATGTMGATMASPLYPLYERAWALRHSTVTVIYVVYMVGVLAAFLFLGRLSDRIGPVPVLKAAGLLLLLGLLLSSIAPGPLVLGVGRVVIGIASGLITSAATLGLILLEPVRSRHAALVASVTTMAGFGLGPFLCGFVAQFAPAPLVAPYLAIIVPVGAVLAGLCTLRMIRPAPVSASVSFKPHLGLPAPEVRPGFFVASLAVFTAYALFSLLASLAPSFLDSLIPLRGPAVSGTSVAAVLFCSALVQLPARRLSVRGGLLIALAFMGIGIVLLAVALRTASGTMFVTADISIGLGHGLAFMSGLRLLNRIAPEDQRSGILSTFLSIAYLGSILPVIAVGYLADWIGLVSAVVTFCLFFAVVCLLLFPLAKTTLKPERLPQV